MGNFRPERWGRFWPMKNRWRLRLDRLLLERIEGIGGEGGAGDIEFAGGIGLPCYRVSSPVPTRKGNT